MRFRVSGVILDQDKSIIAQTYEASNFGDISTRNGGYSNDLTIPLTGKNDAALGFISEINTIDRTPYIKVDAELIDSGAVISKGYLRCKVVTDLRGKKEVSATFFSENTDWFNLIKGKNLTDLDLSEYDHVWNEVNIVAAINDNISIGYTYPLIDYGQLKKYESTSSDIALNTSSFFPAMYVSRMVIQCFKDVGYNVEGTLFNEDRFNRQLQPFSLDSFSRSDEFISLNTKDYSGRPVPVLDTDRQFERIEWVSVPEAPSEIMNIDTEGFYNLTFSISWAYNRLVPVGELDVIFSTGVSPNLGFGDSAVNVVDNDVYTFTKSVTTNQFLELSTEIRGGVSINFKNGEQGEVTITESVFLFEPVKEYNYGDLVNMSSTMPEIKQSDFLRYIFFSYGVIPQVDNTSRIVNLSLFNEVKRNIPTSEDWSNKIDVSKPISTDFTRLLNNYSKVSGIAYEYDDEDPEILTYNSESSTPFGGGNIIVDNEHLGSEKNIYTAPYSAMINILSLKDTMYIPQIKWLGYDNGTLNKVYRVRPKTGLASSLVSISELSFNVYDNMVISKDHGTKVVCEVQDGALTQIEVVEDSQLTAYVTPPIVIVSPPDYSTGVKAEVTPVLNTLNYITSFVITNQGSGYISAPEVTFFTAGSNFASTNSIQFTWFIKTKYTSAIDNINYNMSFENPIFPVNEDKSLKDDYMEDTQEVLSNMKYLSAYFNINESDVVNLNYLNPIYIDKYKSYFFLNKIENYKGPEYSTKCELIKIGGV